MLTVAYACCCCCFSPKEVFHKWTQALMPRQTLKSRWASGGGGLRHFFSYFLKKKKLCQFSRLGVSMVSMVSMDILVHDWPLWQTSEEKNPEPNGVFGPPPPPNTPAYAPVCSYTIRSHFTFQTVWFCCFQFDTQLLLVYSCSVLLSLYNCK